MIPVRSGTRLGIPEGSPVALFSGSLGAKQGVEMIVQSAQLLNDPELHFVICGEGVAEPAIKAAARGIANVHFLPLQPVSELNGLLNLADVHLLPQRQGAVQSVFPSKLIGMLASGRPVVTMAEPDSEIARLVDGCGVCVDHNNVEAFAARHPRINFQSRRSVARWDSPRALARGIISARTWYFRKCKPKSAPNPSKLLIIGQFQHRL